MIYNPNSYAVKINVTNYGLTNVSETWLPDAAAWQSYYNGQSTSLTVAAGGYGNLFPRSVQNGRNFGVVARVSIVKSGTSTPATVTMFDLAYENENNSGGATAFAAADPYTTSLRARGKGAGYYVTMTFPVLSPTTSAGHACSIGATSSSFSGAECSYITDPSGSTSGPLQGAFGQQLNITIPIKNVTGSARKFRIFIGSIGEGSYPFVNYAGGISYYTEFTQPNRFRDVIETDSVANGVTTSVQFSTVITALSSTLYIIGARAVL